MADQDLVEVTIGECIDRTFPIINRRANPTARPDQLYHFTDSSGLVGILSSKELWAGLAVSSNDPSEVIHAVRVGLGLLERSPIGNDRYSELVRRFLRPANWIPQFTIEMHPYVASFCARDDSASQWLHYGRDGAGYAVAFQPGDLQKRPFDLVQVLYDKAHQEALIAELIGAVWEVLDSSLSGLPSAQHDLVLTVAAHVAAQQVWAISSQFKNPAFQSEDEWRLITLDIQHPLVDQGKGVPLKPRFRTVGPRVVPFLPVSFGSSQISELVMGYSVPLVNDDPALAVLWRETLGGDPRVRRSEVPVRP